MYDNHQVDLADHEYSVTVASLYVTGDPDIMIYMSAHGGGTVGEAYAHNGWAYAVTVSGNEIYAGDDLRSGATPATHEAMARTLASFLAAAGRIAPLVRRPVGVRGRSRAVREVLAAEYERLGMFGMDPDDLSGVCASSAHRHHAGRVALAFAGGITWAAHHPHAVILRETDTAYSYSGHAGTVVHVMP